MQNKEIIVITGASGGIGAATVKKLASKNRVLLMLDRNREAVEVLAKEIQVSGNEAEAFIADLSSPEKARRVATEILEKYGRIDSLILNAGTSNNILFVDTDMEKVQYELGVNYLAPMTLIQEFLPGMRERKKGKIVAVTSLTSIVPFPGNSTYTASKAAMQAVIRDLRIELKDSGVDFQSVLPGYTRTSMTHGLERPLSRLSSQAMEPEDVAESIVACLKGSGTALVIPGFTNKVVAMLFQLLPTLMEFILKRAAERLVPNYAKLMKGAVVRGQEKQGESRL